MDEEFKYDDNPLADIILTAMMTDGKEFLENKNIIYLYQELYEHLTLILEDKEDATLLDIDLKVDEKCDFVRIKAKNFMSALWFSGIFPSKTGMRMIEKRGEFIYNGKIYSYNEKTGNLKIKKK